MMLQARGYDATNVDGGTNEWIASGAGITVASGRLNQVARAWAPNPGLSSNRLSQNMIRDGRVSLRYEPRDFVSLGWNDLGVMFGDPATDLGILVLAEGNNGKLSINVVKTTNMVGAQRDMQVCASAGYASGSAGPSDVAFLTIDRIGNDITATEVRWPGGVSASAYIAAQVSATVPGQYQALYGAVAPASEAKELRLGLNAYFTSMGAARVTSWTQRAYPRERRLYARFTQGTGPVTEHLLAADRGIPGPLTAGDGTNRLSGLSELTFVAASGGLIQLTDLGGGSARVSVGAQASALAASAGATNVAGLRQLDFEGASGATVGIRDLGGGSALVTVATGAGASAPSALAARDGTTTVLGLRELYFQGASGASVALSDQGGGSALVTIVASAEAGTFAVSDGPHTVAGLRALSFQGASGASVFVTDQGGGSALVTVVASAEAAPLTARDAGTTVPGVEDILFAAGANASVDVDDLGGGTARVTIAATGGGGTPLAASAGALRVDDIRELSFIGIPASGTAVGLTNLGGGSALVTVSASGAQCAGYHASGPFLPAHGPTALPPSPPYSGASTSFCAVVSK